MLLLASCSDGAAANNAPFLGFVVLLLAMPFCNIARSQYTGFFPFQALSLQCAMELSPSPLVLGGWPGTLKYGVFLMGQDDRIMYLRVSQDYSC